MDIDLLNYYIRKIGFKIENSSLTLELEPSSYPLGYQYQIALSDNKKEILHFFGYDVTVNYDHLTEKNLFVYLSSSKSFNERHIRYDSFKVQSPKNSQHRKFNDFLVKNRKYKSEYISEDLEKLRNVWRDDAIKQFDISNEIERYRYEKNAVDKIMQMYNAAKIKSKVYRKFDFFIRYWGVNDVKDWDQKRFDSEWLKFQDENWSNLQHF